MSRITINDIAKAAGVSKTTVSLVLNNKANASISQATRERIMELVRHYAYTPMQSARALSTHSQRTIGYFIADDITGGFANIYFATFLNGIEEECKRNGYMLNVGLFNFTNIDRFILPSPVSAACVDGFIISGYVEDRILEKLISTQRPCVCIGDYMSKSDNLCTISIDTIQGKLILLKHIAAKGRHRVLFPVRNTVRDKLEIERMDHALRNTPELKDLQIEYYFEEDRDLCQTAERLVKRHLELPEAKRPTLYFTHDQLCIELKLKFESVGLTCPRDVSLVSAIATDLCRFTSPAITGLTASLKDIGIYAARLLINHIQSGKRPGFSDSKNDFQGELFLGGSIADLNASQGPSMAP